MGHEAHGLVGGSSGEGEFRIFVRKIPECEECPFYIEDTNVSYLGKDKFRCMLRGKVVTAQYGGMDISEVEKRDCIFEVLPCLKPENKGKKCPTCGCSECGGGSGGSGTRVGAGLHHSRTGH